MTALAEDVGLKGRGVGGGGGGGVVNAEGASATRSTGKILKNVSVLAKISKTSCQWPCKFFF
jgi:hypothetical protein